MSSLRQIRFISGKVLPGVNAGLSDVSSQFKNAPAAQTSNDFGIYVNDPDNIEIIRSASDGSIIQDGMGNTVYGRLTFDGVFVWTLTYFSLVNGVETPFTFSSPTDLEWFFKINFNPAVSSLVPAPVLTKQTFLLSSTDITNQFVDLAQQAVVGSIIFAVKGQGYQVENDDYFVNYTAGLNNTTRVFFNGDLITGKRQALVVNDKVVVHYVA